MSDFRRWRELGQQLRVDSVSEQALEEMREAGAAFANPDDVAEAKAQAR